MTAVVLALCCMPVSVCGRTPGDGPAVESRLAFRRYTTQDGLPQMLTERIFQDRRGYIYVGTLSGFVRFDGREFTPFLRGHRWNVVGFMETARGVSALSFRQQWLVSGDEVRLRPLDAEGRWLLNNLNATDLPDGYLLFEDEQEQHRWVGRAAGGDGFERICDDALLDGMTPDRHLYVDSARGVLIPQGKVYSYHRSGGVLRAFAADGIYRVEGDSLTLETAFSDWSPDYGFIVRSTGDGLLLIADSHSIYGYDTPTPQSFGQPPSGRKLPPLSPSDSPPRAGGQRLTKLAGGFNLVKDMLVDRWGRLWVATYQGLYCFFGRQFTNHRLTDGGDIVRAVTPTVQGTLNGKIISDGRVVYDNPEDYFVPAAAVVGDRVYLAASSDVACVRGDSVGWLHLPYSRYQFVAEAQGRLILGLRNLVAAYDPATGRVDTLSTEIAHPWCAAMDDGQRLWVGSTFGLYRVSPCYGDIGDSCRTEQVTYQDRRLIVTTMEADTRGAVFFASGDSLFVVRHGEVQQLNSQLPMLAGHEVRSLHVSPKGYLVVAVVDGLVVARIDGDYHVGDARYLNHLNGFTLIEPQKATMAEQEDGTVWLCGVEETTTFKPAELLAFSEDDTFVAPPLKWYEHWWAWLAALLLAAAVVYLLAYAYLRHRHGKEMVRLKREKKQKELQLSTVRLKAIPHFHANVLAAIEYYVMNNSPEEASRYLKLYSDFTNLTLKDIDRPARTVAEEVDYVTKYLELQKLRYGERLTYSIAVADNVDRKALLPTMLLHTYVENAIKHGISPKPDGGHVDVVITRYQDDTVVTVEDNGVGRRKAAQLSQNTTKMGLRILSEQIQLWNKSNSHRIRQHVRNIKDANGKTAGTHFDLTVPKDYVFD